MLTVRQQAEFEKHARPLIEFLLMNCPPDVTVVVTNKEAQLLESAAAVPLYRATKEADVQAAPEAENVISFPRAGEDRSAR